MKKKLFVTIFVILTIVTSSFSAFAITSSGACAIDVKSGNVLYEHNPDTRLAPASMTKLMTAYIIFDKIAKGELSKDTYITCSSNAAKLSRNSNATNVPLTAGEQYSVDELIYAIMLPSACAACTLIGEHISGSEREFAKLMNSYAADLGLDAYYEDASGLSNNNRITPRSMALLGVYFIRNYPDILNYTSTKSFTFRGKTYNNTNQLLPGKGYPYEGADGLKTGTTTLAGKCLTATAERDGIRIVGVTMRSTSASARYTDIHAILNAGFTAANDVNNTLYANSADIYINDVEIPSYYRGDNDGESVILAEHLANYGFNVHYNAEEHTVYIEREKQNEFSPIEDGLEENARFALLKKDSTVKVNINNDGYLYSFEKLYDIGGYVGISVDELKYVFNFDWRPATNSGHFTL